MFRGFFLLTVLLISNPAFAAAPFCVQTFNFYGAAYSPEKTKRMESIAEIVRTDSDPCEVIQFQEVWTESLFKILTAGIQSTSYAGYFAQVHAEGEDQGKKLGLVGLYSQREFSGEKEEVYLYSVNNHGGILDDIRGLVGVAKGIHLVSRNMGDTGKILFLNTHTHPMKQEIRIAQMVELVQFFWNATEGTPYIPSFLTGDFNAVPGSLEMRLVRDVLLFRDSYLEANRGYKSGDCTLCKENPHGFHRDDRVVDYVFFRDGSTTEINVENSAVNWKGTKDQFLSDHYGVRSWFSIDAARTTPVSSAERDARIKRAIATVEEAEIFLTKKDKRYLRTTLRRVADVRAKLQEALLNEDRLSYFSR